MAVAHLRAYLAVDGIEVGALCNPSGRNLDGDFSDVHGNVGSDEPVKLDMTGVAAYRSLDDLLADDSIDLIDITTPTFLHHEQALDALTSGKHVLCEKPMARTSQQAKEIAEAAQAAQVPSAVPLRGSALEPGPAYRGVKPSDRFERLPASQRHGIADQSDGRHCVGRPPDLFALNDNAAKPLNVLVQYGDRFGYGRHLLPATREEYARLKLKRALQDPVNRQTQIRPDIQPALVLVCGFVAVWRGCDPVQRSGDFHLWRRAPPTTHCLRSAP